MSLFPDFTDMFSVGNTISQSSNTKPDDVFNTKNALAQTGYYQVPDFGITDTPDMGMIDGLKGFQQDNGLKVDGVMKPGGPTESKIGETLANTDLLAKKEPAKPKVPKIDPLTGLPEVKMPKLKKPAADLWKQVPATTKPKANPWFQSPKVKPLPDEDHSSNTRAIDGMLHYSNNGSLPSLFASTLKGGDEKAVNEFANFMQQLNERKPERVESFDKDVMSQLPDTAQKAILALGETQASEKKGMSFERVAQLQKQYEQDPSGFQKDESEPLGKKKEDASMAQSESQNDEGYQDSAKCMELKIQYDNANNEAKKAWQDYQAKNGELSRKGQEGQDALNNLKQLLTETALNVLLAMIPAGRIAAAISKLKEEVTDPVNWLDVADNAWTLYHGMDEEIKLQGEADAFLAGHHSWIKERDNIKKTAYSVHNCKTHEWYKG